MFCYNFASPDTFHQTGYFHAQHRRKELRQLCKRLAVLAIRTPEISVQCVVTTDRRLDQPLHKKRLIARELVPQFFKRIMALKELSLIELLYAVSKKLIHRATNIRSKVLICQMVNSRKAYSPAFLSP